MKQEHTAQEINKLKKDNAALRKFLREIRDMGDGEYHCGLVAHNENINTCCDFITCPEPLEECWRCLARIALKRKNRPKLSKWRLV
jgi:hypothetical protein